MPSLDLRQVSDRFEIDDLLTRYARSIDTGDWDRRRVAKPRVVVELVWRREL